MVLTQTMPDNVRTVLATATVEQNIVKLPGQLDRKTYIDVDKALKALGGKWNRYKGGHEFGSAEAAERIVSAVEEGEYIDPKLNGYFPTPQWLAQDMAERAEIMVYHTVLEPSAGQGAIAEELAVFTGSRAVIDCVEILPENVTVLQDKGFNVVGTDFLAWDSADTYDRIVMNPPFAGTTYVDHIVTAYDRLAPNGRLVAIAPAGILFRSDRKTRELRELVETSGVVVQEHPEGTFKDAGTGVRTCTVLIER